MRFGSLPLPVLAALLTLAPCLPTRAENSQERARRVVDESVAALGGDRFLNMENRVETGRAYSFYHEKISGLSIARIVTRYLPGITDTANKLAVEEHEYFGKKEDSGVIFTQDEGWQINYHGAQPLPADELARYKETTLRSVLYILRVRLHEPGMIFESRGADVLDNRPVEIVDITDIQNRTTTVYFDQINKVPVRQVFYHRDPKTRERDEEITEFSKYRDIGGVMWPFDIHRERNGYKIYEMFSESGKIDQDLPDTEFLLPSGIKLLKSS